jgi:hypothetical protein
MLRVSKVEEWLHRAPTSPDMSTHSNCVIIRSGDHYDGKQGVSLTAGVSTQTAGAKALCLHLVMIPPGTRGMPHYHAGPATSCTSRPAPRTSRSTGAPSRPSQWWPALLIPRSSKAWSS